ncbi:MAG: FMN-binding negative transcriptional regulator [Alphaproteobacteria bacterium]|nr:FMN-binding negative transcriptional regulator [Alphaproteobacteria bacterium]
MFLPEVFKVVDVQKLFSDIEKNSFGMLISAGDGPEDVPFTTPLPMEIVDGVLYGHLARANPHWRLFDGIRVAQAVFSGPHAYVSPTWYPDPTKSVPTWNYTLSRVIGRPTVIEDEAKITWLMNILSHKYEGASGWAPDMTDPGFMAGMRRGIVAFQMKVDQVDGKAKLSQNKPQAVAQIVADRLQSQGETEISEAMRAVFPEA